MLRWCDVLIRAAAPLVPSDIRANWMREWRAELAYACARARKNGRRTAVHMPVAHIRRFLSCRLASLGSVEDRDDLAGPQTRLARAQGPTGIHVRDAPDAGDRHRRHDGDLWRGECRAAPAAAVSRPRCAGAPLQDHAQAAGSRRRHRVAAGLHRLAARQHGLHRGRRVRQRLVGADRRGRC